MTDEDLDLVEAACQPGVWGYDPQLALTILELIREVRGWRAYAKRQPPKRARLNGHLERVEDSFQ